VRELLSSFLGNPPDKVQILREVMRKTFADPEFYAEFKKLVGEEPTPLLPEDLRRPFVNYPGTEKLSNCLIGFQRRRHAATTVGCVIFPVCSHFAALEVRSSQRRDK
jgi:hypothetical protein